MDSTSFLGLESVSMSSGTEGQWSMAIRPGLVTGGNFLWGGAGLAASVRAMELLSGRQCVWATSQYLSYARTHETMTIDVKLAVVGHQITQARSVARVGDREILTVNAALGDRDFPTEATFAMMPDVPRPETLTARPHHYAIENTIHENLVERFVRGRTLEELDGTLSDGRTILWAKIPDVLTGVDTATLAILGDFVPMGLGQALGMRAGGNSLDNTLRVLRLVPTEWVLLDIQMQGVRRGFGHGSVNMFAEDGTLLATASQSCIARVWRDSR